MNEEDDDEDDEMDEEINLKAEEDNDDDEIKYKAYSMNFESEQINGNFKEGQAPLKLTKSQYKRKKRHTESDDDNI